MQMHDLRLASVIRLLSADPCATISVLTFAARYFAFRLEAPIG